MRPILTTLLAVAALLWVGCHLDVCQVPATWSERRDALTFEAVPAVWRRTPDGWEDRTAWTGPSPSARGLRSASPHPAVVASLQLLLSLGSLIALGPISRPAAAVPPQRAVHRALTGHCPLREARCRTPERQCRAG